MQTFKNHEADSDEDPEDNTAAAIKKRHRREIERAERENRENTSALLELRDMEGRYHYARTAEALPSSWKPI